MANSDYRFIEPLESGGAELLPDSSITMRYVNGILGAIATLLVVSEVGIGGAIVALVFALLDRLLVANARQQAENELLAFYANVCEPILEWQQSPTDNMVYQRAQRHRDLLAQAKNGLYEAKKISVVEMYWKEGDYVETFQEFEERRQDIRRDYLRKWAETVSKDEIWRKRFLYNQFIDLPSANRKEVGIA